MIGDHQPAREFAPIDEEVYRGVMRNPLLARCHARKLIGVISSIAAGMIFISGVLPPNPPAWAEHDPQAVWGLVAESHGLRATEPTRATTREQKKRRVAKKRTHRQEIRKTSIPTPRKGPEPLAGEATALPSPDLAGAPATGTWSLVPAFAKEEESAPFSIAETPAAKKGGSSAAPQPLVAHEAVQVQVTMGTSLIVDLPGQVHRASVTNPEIANIQIVSPNQILVNGKAPGITTLIAWADEKRQYYDIVVKSNLSLLEQAMKEISPQEEIGVKAVQTSVVLSGTVSNPSLIARAADVAKAFLPDKATVVNLIRLGEPHQIMLKVEVAEVNRSALRELGLDFIAIGSTFTLAFLGATTGGLLATVFSVPDNRVEVDQRLSALVREGDTRVLLRALEQKGLIKSLARPNLIAASGVTANFIVGGEFPVPIVTANTAVIEFKPFGIRLGFTPTLNDFGSINLKITPEVSDLDFENAVTFSGFRIPALRTRRASTIVDLKPGQSLAIGGLISSDDRKSISKFPILGDIPLLGALFRSTNFIRNETDLIILVTPEIVKPLEPAQTPNLEEQMKMTPTEEKEIRQIPPGR